MSTATPAAFSQSSSKTACGRRSGSQFRPQSKPRTRHARRPKQRRIGIASLDQVGPASRRLELGRITSEAFPPASRARMPRRPGRLRCESVAARARSVPASTRSRNPGRPRPSPRSSHRRTPRPIQPVRSATTPNASAARIALATFDEDVSLRVKMTARAARTHAWIEKSRVSRSEPRSGSHGSSFQLSDSMNRPASCAVASAAIAVASG